MALNTVQRIRTSLELNENFALSGLTLDDLTKELELTKDQVQAALDMSQECDRPLSGLSVTI